MPVFDRLGFADRSRRLFIRPMFLLLGDMFRLSSDRLLVGRRRLFVIRSWLFVGRRRFFGCHVIFVGRRLMRWHFDSGFARKRFGSACFLLMDCIGACPDCRLGRERSIIGKNGFGMFRFDFANCCLQLVKLPLQHRFRRARLHTLELPLHSTASALVDFHPHLGSIFRQAVNRPPDNCDKIRHSYFL